MDYPTLVDTMLSVGKKLSIDTKNLGALPLKLIVLSLKFVPRVEIWTEMWGADSYVHWELVDSQPNKNIFGGCTEWLALLGLCQWGENFQRVPGHVLSEHPPLVNLRKHLRDCGLDPGGADGWNLACKIFVLMLVRDLPSLHVLENLTCGVFKRNTRDGCMQFLAKQADNLFTPDQYRLSLLLVLGNTLIQTEILEQTVALGRSTREDLKNSLKLSRMTVIQGRPRLRDRVNTVLKTDERKAQVDSTLSTWDSYTGFCYKHQFPPTLSERVKTRLYFLAAQTR